MPQISLIETFAKLCGKAFSQVGEQTLAISGAGGSTLLEHYYISANGPEGANLNYIYCMQDLLAGGLDYFAQTGKETADVMPVL